MFVLCIDYYGKVSWASESCRIIRGLVVGAFLASRLVLAHLPEVADSVAEAPLLIVVDAFGHWSSNFDT